MARTEYTEKEILDDVKRIADEMRKEVRADGVKNGTRMFKSWSIFTGDHVSLQVKLLIDEPGKEFRTVTKSCAI